MRPTRGLARLAHDSEPESNVSNASHVASA